MIVAVVLIASGCGGYVPTAQQPGDQVASGVRSPSPSSVSSTSPCQGPALPDREAPAITYDGDRNAPLVFGGDVDGASVADTLLFRGGCWGLQQAMAGPSPRQSAALVYDPEVHLSILIGGRKDDPHGPQTIPADVWVLSPQGWSQLSGAPHFSDASAAYDVIHHVIVVLGSSPEGVGTWTWDGTTWRLATIDGPRPRANPAMCFDVSSNSVVEFGGANSGGPILGDTWLWNGSSWAKQQPLHSPPARFEAAASCGLHPLLYGGWGSYSGLVLSDTWMWIDGDWVQEYPSHKPSGRTTMPIAAFDGSRQWIFDGLSSSGAWRWSGNDWTAAT